MTKRTGNRPGQGRQPTIAPRGQVERIEARVSSAQKAEYIKRGGSQALRDWLDGKPDDESHEESEYYAELERGYSQDRI